MLGLGSVYPAQPEAGLIVRVLNDVTPSSPVARIAISAWFDYAPNYAELFAVAAFDLFAADGRWDEFNNCVIPAFDCPPDPRIEGPAVHEIIVAQVHFPPFIPGLPDNPIAVAEGLWRTDDFRARHVRLHTLIRRMGVYESMTAPRAHDVPAPFGEAVAYIRVGEPCYADCDTSTGMNVLDIFDFLCFQNLYAAADPYACDCDTGTGPGVCDVFDFLCFQSRFVVGCP